MLQLLRFPSVPVPIAVIVTILPSVPVPIAVTVTILLSVPVPSAVTVILFFLQFRFQLFFFNLVTSQRFDAAIMVVILLNMASMTLEFHAQPEYQQDMLNFVNNLFIYVFTMEFLMKFIALRLYYFKQPWNVFDFIVVFLSVLGKSLCLSLSLEI